MQYLYFEKSIDKLFEEAALQRVALAVSGGVDSIAMLYLMSDWAKNKNVDLVVLNVNHNLRIESAQEAKLVQMHAKKLGHQCHLLCWDNGQLDLSSRLQEKAREARYRLMTDKCHELGIKELCTAHHFDDLLETYYMRKNKQSGVFGLSYSSSYFVNEVRILRPLLEFSKNQLQQYLQYNNIAWLEDISNISDKYERNRVRKVLAKMDQQEKERLIAEMRSVNQRARELNKELLTAIAEIVSIDNFGFAIIDLKKYRESIDDIQIQLISHVLTIISGSVTTPRFRNISPLIDKINCQSRIDCSLHGCILKEQGADLLIFREKSQINNEVCVVGKSLLWDGRFKIMGKNFDNYQISYLTEQDYKAIKDELDLSNLQKKGLFSYKMILFTLPIVKKLEKIVAIPHISYYDNKNLCEKFDVMFCPSFISRFTHFL